MVPEPSRLRALMMAATLLLGVLLVGVAVSVMRSAPVEPMAMEPGSRLEQLEAFVARNPDDLAAQMGLGDEYFAVNRYDAALDRYLTVLQVRPDEPRALARAGWIAFEGGDSNAAQRLVTQSLDVRPDDPEALWFLAQIRLYGLDDATGAVAPLRRLLGLDELSADLRREARTLLTRARG